MTPNSYTRDATKSIFEYFENVSNGTALGAHTGDLVEQNRQKVDSENPAFGYVTVATDAVQLIDSLISPIYDLANLGKPSSGTALSTTMGGVKILSKGASIISFGIETDKIAKDLTVMKKTDIQKQSKFEAYLLGLMGTAAFVAASGVAAVALGVVAPAAVAVLLTAGVALSVASVIAEENEGSSRITVTVH